MILYCCCLDVDDDTDSHPSCSPSCFGSFYFAMKFTSRDRRINGVVADLRGLAFKSDAQLDIKVSANYLLTHREQIANAILDVVPPFGHTLVVIRKGHVYSYLCTGADAVGDGDIWWGVAI